MLKNYFSYDIPRNTPPKLKKSNSRVSANGKLSLRVESFKQVKIFSFFAEKKKNNWQSFFVCVLLIVR